ncbi:MAG: FAD-dependent tricarballylate dehydrogenase TcuA [Candidatus Lambdaproteobacteria bacterium]|nr:FAD-dependent tricarballylate dehydrogenase TcuA [Candidatus Lambdaproteobacteria bacterium]
MAKYDVIVIGAGNAALAAAVSAREQGAERVLVLEKAPEELRGGNTHYSGGAFRFAYEKPDDLRAIVPDADKHTPGFFENVEPYSAETFWRDLKKVTENRTDPRLAQILIGNSYDTVRWMKKVGIRMEPAVMLGAIRFGGKIKFLSGAVIRAVGEGIGLSRMWFGIAEQREVEIRYQTRAARLLQDGSGRVTGVLVQGPKGYQELSAAAVVLGCGGFESNPEWRARYLGRPWDLAKVRGTAFNTGDGLRMAFEVGAVPHGQYTGLHSTPIDADAPPFGDRKLTDKSNRLSYTYSVMVNSRGQHFADEGEEFNLLTYAKMGQIILTQPGGVAYQLFDSKVTELLEPRYKTGKPLTADTLEGLVRQLPIDHEQALHTLREYHAALKGGQFNPMVKDGLRTQGLAVDKTNWAQPLDTPPYYAYPVTGGVTFTFGGVLIGDDAQVMDVGYRPIEGLYACGEMVGGLFHYNYPGGSGLVSGAVFGRIAGRSAAQSAARAAAAARKPAKPKAAPRGRKAATRPGPRSRKAARPAARTRR